jgi:hypothetical protein
MCPAIPQLYAFIRTFPLFVMAGRFDPAIQCRHHSNADPDFTIAWMAGSRLCVRLRRGTPGPAMTNEGAVDTIRNPLHHAPPVERIENYVPVIAPRTSPQRYLTLCCCGFLLAA